MKSKVALFCVLSSSNVRHVGPVHGQEHLKLELGSNMQVFSWVNLLTDWSKQ